MQHRQLRRRICITKRFCKRRFCITKKPTWLPTMVGPWAAPMISPCLHTQRGINTKETLLWPVRRSCITRGHTWLPTMVGPWAAPMLSPAPLSHIALPCSRRFSPPEICAALVVVVVGRVHYFARACIVAERITYPPPISPHLRPHPAAVDHIGGDQSARLPSHVQHAPKKDARARALWLH